MHRARRDARLEQLPAFRDLLRGGRLGRGDPTINPALSATRSRTRAKHAEDKLVFFDVTFAPLVEKLAPQLEVGAPFHRDDRPREHGKTAASPRIPNLLCYEDLLEAETAQFEWPSFDERTAACLLHLGNDGNPKGALYSHRSTILHA